MPKSPRRASKGAIGMWLLAIAGITSSAILSTSRAHSRTVQPTYTETGQLSFPAGYEHWMFVGSSFGLSYSERAPGANVHHVFLEPSAYQDFVATGEFPVGTMLALEIYSAGERIAPSRGGAFPGQLLALEFAVKDPERFPDTWAYFDFSDRQPSASPFPSSSCHSCHVEHAQTDNVFTQFYPRLRRTPSHEG